MRCMLRRERRTLPHDAIEAKCGCGGDKNDLIPFHENVINQKHCPDHPDSVTGSVDKVEDAVAELETLKENCSKLF
jgi:hypothetical protein